ncbi:MAG: hypothetical protein M9894_17480 [Planctomycetes bacterium]|nr:hypothetical protein [Planctomycetota bacterium]
MADDDDGWRALDAQAVGVTRDGDRLLDAVQEGPGGGVACRVRLVPRHPFFFEHEVDHLPGLYLLEAGRQVALVAARRRVDLPARPATAACAFRVRFDGFAEKEGPVVADADARPAEAGEVELDLAARQAGRALLRGRARWSFVDEAALQDLLASPCGPEARAPGGRTPVPREAVHKRLDENVLLEWVARAGDGFDARVRALPEHPYFEPGRLGRWPGLYLVEACRQLAEAIAHLHLGTPQGDAFVLEDMTVSLPALARVDAAVRVVALPHEVERGRAGLRRLRLHFTARQGERVVLLGDAGARVVPGRVYRRARHAGRGVA